MTAEEMLYRAEVAYDFITGFSAEGISRKEWSLFLTEAQMDIVKLKLPSKGTELSFEETELLAEQFEELTMEAIDANDNVTTIPSINQNGGTDDRSVFYDIPSNFLYGLVEKLDYLDEDCLPIKVNVVKTVQLDFFLNIFNITPPNPVTEASIDLIMAEYSDIIAGYNYSENRYSYYSEELRTIKHRIKPVNNNYYVANVRNPFKKPSVELAWRLKLKDSDGDKRHELIATKKIKHYYLKYLMVPPPIIIFSDDYNGDNDTIQGVNLNSVFASGASLNSVLNDAVCDTIVNRAVMIAQKSLGDVQSYQLSGVDNAPLN